MDQVSSRRQRGPAPSGRVSRFPVFKPWQDPQQQDRRERRRASPLPPSAAPEVRARYVTGLGSSVRCRQGLHQLGPQNLLATAGGLSCRACFQDAIRRYG
jgi:hypothetical protein